jgi:hypothetical protein
MSPYSDTDPIVTLHQEGIRRMNGAVFEQRFRSISSHGDVLGDPIPFIPEKG